MASLVKNGSNYGLVWTDSSRTPSQVRESLKTESRRKAEVKKKQLEWEYHNGEHDPWRRKWYEKDHLQGTSLRGAVEQFIRYKSRAKGQEGWSYDNAKKEGFVMRKFVRIVGNIEVSALEKKDLERFYYRDNVTSDHTRNSDYISINTFLNWCIARGYLKAKPIFRPKKPQSKVPKFIYPEELKGLIEWKLDDIERNIKASNFYTRQRRPYWMILGWLVLAGTGMRPKELMHLKKNHVERGSVLIGEDFTTKVKAERRVPLLFESEYAVQILLDNNFREKDPIMAKSDHLLGRKPSSQEKLSRAFSKAWENKYPDKPKRTLYTLKDMFCVRFLTDDSIPSASGMKLNELREILGHASLETTQKYLKAIPFGTSLAGSVLEGIRDRFEKHLTG